MEESESSESESRDGGYRKPSPNDRVSVVSGRSHATNPAGTGKPRYSVISKNIPKVAADITKKAKTDQAMKYENAPANGIKSQNDHNNGHWIYNDA